MYVKGMRVITNSNGDNIFHPFSLFRYFPECFRATGQLHPPELYCITQKIHHIFVLPIIFKDTLKAFDDFRNK